MKHSPSSPSFIGTIGSALVWESKLLGNREPCSNKSLDLGCEARVLNHRSEIFLFPLAKPLVKPVDSVCDPLISPRTDNSGKHDRDLKKITELKTETINATLVLCNRLTSVICIAEY